MAEWKPIKTFNKEDREEVDLWLQIYASPRSMGWADAFRVINAYKIDGKWFHRQDGKEMELYTPYVTHWMPIPNPPKPKK